MRRIPYHQIDSEPLEFCKGGFTVAGGYVVITNQYGYLLLTTISQAKYCATSMQYFEKSFWRICTKISNVLPYFCHNYVVLCRNPVSIIRQMDAIIGTQ